MQMPWFFVLSHVKNSILVRNDEMAPYGLFDEIE